MGAYRTDIKMAFSRTANQTHTHTHATISINLQKYEEREREGKKETTAYVGVSSRSELLDATVGTNVFNAVAEGNFVLNGIFTTTGLLFAAFGLHYNIHAFL